MQTRPLTFPITAVEFARRLRRYVEIFPPRGFRNLRFVREHSLIIWDTPVEEIYLTLYGDLSDRPKVPLLELHAVEDGGLCFAHIGCDEPGDPRWLEQLLVRLDLARHELRAEGWPDWLAPSSADLEVPFGESATVAPVSLTEAATPPGPEPNPKPRRASRGAKGLTSEEVEDLIRKWRERPDRMGVDEFCDNLGDVSKTTFYKYMPKSEL